MVRVERTWTVRRPVAEVVGYLRDFANTESWDPGTTRCTRQDTGPIATGSRWHNVSQFRGRETELDYEMVRDDPDHITFVGRNKTATSTDDLRFAAAGADTRITYRATIEFHGLAKLATPFMQRVFERLGDEVVQQMSATLESLPS